MTTSNSNFKTTLGLRPNTAVEEKKDVKNEKIEVGEVARVCIVDGENMMHEAARLGISMAALLEIVKRIKMRFTRVIIVFKRSFKALGKLFDSTVTGVEYIRLIPVDAKGSGKSGAKKSFDDAFILCLASKLKLTRCVVTIYSNDSFESNRYGNDSVVCGMDTKIQYFAEDKVSTAHYMGYTDVFSPKNEFTLDILLEGMKSVVGLAKINVAG